MSPQGEEARAGIWIAFASLETTAIAAYSADWDHYTWWYHALFTGVALASACGFDGHLLFLFQSVQILVMSSVLVMGLHGCVVFRDTYAHVGAGVYVPGDFSMHWLPGLVQLALIRYDKVCTDRDTVVIQIWSGYGFFLVWNYLHDPWEVYGCTLPETLVVFLPFVLTSALTLAALVALDWFEYKRVYI